MNSESTRERLEAALYICESRIKSDEEDGITDEALTLICQAQRAALAASVAPDAEGARRERTEDAL